LVDFAEMVPTGGRRKPPRFAPPAPPDDPAALGRLAVRAAMAQGFAAAGVVVGSSALSWREFRQWLDGGSHGEMEWLERDAGPRRDFSEILPYCASVLSVAWSVPPGGPGNVARYARGDDYHRVVRDRLKEVARRLGPVFPPGTHFRVCVDTAPLLEREVALRAGLGFIGRNGMLIVPGAGSHVVLGELLTDVALGEPSPPPPPLEFGRCGDCRACLDSCPTGAFLAPPFLDARRCLSYLTIEKRGPLGPWEREALGGRLFGCDVCQEVCPWNPPSHGDAAPDDPSLFPPASLDPAALVRLDAAAFKREFFRTALWRATATGLARNARAALDHPAKEVR
jgi:epoxyqueuosine reductase